MHSTTYPEFSPLFFEQQLTESERKAVTIDFEQRTHTALSGSGIQPWSSGRVLRDRDGRTLTDVDASVQAGSVLVVVDCYSSPWSHALDLGENKQVRSRASNLAEKVSKWQRQWREIIERHASLLPPGVDAVLPVVVTAGPEWIASEEGSLWLSDDVPVALTTPELIQGIRTWDVNSLPNLLRAP